MDMNQNNDRRGGSAFEEEAAAAAARSRRMKRTILIIFACMVIFVPVALLLTRLIDNSSVGKPEEETKRKQPTIIFCTPDYEYDILKDEEYLNLNRYVMYADNGTGLSVMLDDRSVKNYGPAVLVLTEMLDCIIKGDAEGYNALFSDNYYDNYEPAPLFTMQQVYDILLTKMETKHIQPEKGREYVQYEFTVEYKIHKNNGTFRTDIGLDESRKQYFILSDKEGKNVKIDRVLNYRPE